MANCPECDAELHIEPDDLEEMEVGDPWDCGECGSRLRVASVDPLEFDADDEDEDEEEDDDEDSDSDDDFDDEDDEESDEDGDWDE